MYALLELRCAAFLRGKKAERQKKHFNCLTSSVSVKELKGCVKLISKFKEKTLKTH